MKKTIEAKQEKKELLFLVKKNGQYLILTENNYIAHLLGRL